MVSSSATNREVVTGFVGESVLFATTPTAMFFRVSSGLRVRVMVSFRAAVAEVLGSRMFSRILAIS